MPRLIVASVSVPGAALTPRSADVQVSGRLVRPARLSGRHLNASVVGASSLSFCRYTSSLYLQLASHCTKRQQRIRGFRATGETRDASYEVSYRSPGSWDPKYVSPKSPRIWPTFFGSGQILCKKYNIELEKVNVRPELMALKWPHVTAKGCVFSVSCSSVHIENFMKYFKGRWCPHFI